MVAHTGGRHDADAPSASVQRRRHSLPIRPGRFHHDERRRGKAALRGQRGDQRLPAVRVVGERERGRRQRIPVGDGDRERARGNINPDPGHGIQRIQRILLRRKNGRRTPSCACQLVRCRCFASLNGPMQHLPYLGDDLAGLDAYQALTVLRMRYSTSACNIQDAKNANKKDLCFVLSSLYFLAFSASWRFKKV